MIVTPNSPATKVDALDYSAQGQGGQVPYQEVDKIHNV